MTLYPNEFKIRRKYDDKFQNIYSEREDLTLIVRALDENLKTKIIDMENCWKNLPSTNKQQNTTLKVCEDDLNKSFEEIEDSNSLHDASNYVTLEKEDQKFKPNYTCSPNRTTNEEFDKDGKVISYVDFNEFNKIIEENEDLKREMDNFCLLLEQNKDFESF